jgi:hypothetical protein
VILPTICAQPWWPELREEVFTGCARRENAWRDRHGRRKPHRPRVIPEVFLAWVAFCLDSEVDLLPWVEHQSDEEMWRSLGVPTRDGVCRPSYNVVYRQFRALYPLLGALRGVTDELAKAIVAKVPDFLVDVAIDGTEWAAAVQLYHDCGDDCPLGKGGENLGKYAKGPLHNMTSEQAAAMRAQVVDASAGDEDGEADRGERKVTGDAGHRVEGDVNTAYRVWRQTDNGLRPYLRIRTDSGHWFMVRDVVAGIRMYDGKDAKITASWVGRHLISSTCLATGLCGAVVAVSASKNEPAFYPELLAAGERATGWPTLTASTDKAATVRDVTTEQTCAGRLHISPLRNHRQVGVTTTTSC